MFPYSRKIFKPVVFCTVCLLSLCNTSVFPAAAHLDFPVETPGMCAGCVDCTQNPPPLLSTRGAPLAGAVQIFEHFTLQDSTAANADIYFPMNGNQPTTPEAARWSCANVDANNPGSSITQWYVDAFFAERFGFAANVAPLTVRPIVSIQNNVIQASFDGAFLTMAANPVGRVLLYRLLIEIRRQVMGGNGYGWCERLTVFNNVLSGRNNGRSINIVFSGAASETEFQRCPDWSWEINFNPNDNASDFVQIINDQLSMDSGQDDLDIGLFHEMLHWFQFLRHPVRFFDEGIEACNPSRYMYLSRCYYGNVSEQFTWGGMDHQEMRTILGAPNYNTQAEVDLFHPDALLSNDPGGFLAATNTAGTVGYLPPECAFYEGDDLSENAYRMARHTAGVPVRMRFGHGYFINPNVIKTLQKMYKFQLAHLVAKNCCDKIVNPQINNWGFTNGEALVP
ncbi:MAG: hypothetical protein LBJ13_01785 [Puniceicoccales bacterium]|jgi:hypothetical protein|nr:hypothetical protein [Puniceicoccales bacterium]